VALRYGPPVVRVRAAECVGEAGLDPAGLEVESHSNFVSVRANVNVIGGKWMFEVVLGTAGIQQIGWAPQFCPCNNEEGIGDFPHSYAYDGQRVKKWNVSCQSYGHAWVPGDVIGCCLDLDGGEIWFRRNGECLGRAFERVERAFPGMAYSPALSLSRGERSTLNFGGTPFLYPVEGFAPLQDAPPAERVRCMEERAAEAVALGERLELSSGQGGASPSGGADEDSVLANVVATAKVCEGVGPLFHDRYFVEHAFVPALLRLREKAPRGLRGLVGLLATCLEEHELVAMVEYSLTRLSMLCRTALIRHPDFLGSSSVPPLQVAEAMLSDDRIMYLLNDSSYAYPLLEGFLVFKQPNANDLAPIFPEVWWKECKRLHGDGCDKEVVEERYRQVLETAEAVEDAQMALFMIIMHSKGTNYRALNLPRTRGTFLGFFTWLAEKNKGVTRNVQPPGLSENSVLLSAYGILLRVLYPQFPRRDVDLKFGGKPFQEFHPEVLTEPLISQMSRQEGRSSLYSDIARFGGTFSHISKELGPGHKESPEEWKAQIKALVLEEGGDEGHDGDMGSPTWHSPPEDAAQENVSEAEEYAKKLSHSGGRRGVGGGGEEAAALKRLLVQPQHPLTQSCLFSLMVLLYHFGMNTNFKNASYQLLIQRTAISQLEDMDLRISMASDSLAAGHRMPLQAQLRFSTFEEYVENLKGTRRLFYKDVVESVRQCYWHKAVINQPWRLKAVFHACAQTARVITGLSKRGEVFQYIPEAYMEAMVDSFHTLRRGDALSLENYGLDAMDDIVTCLVLHFSDGRVLNPDVRDIILQSINMTLHHSEFLHAFERNLEARTQMIPKLLDCFGPRFWIPVSNILVRLCRGEGFGENPYKISSSVMKKSFCEAYETHSSSFSEFLTRLFNMLNWTATELTVALKELVPHIHDTGHASRTTPEAQQSMRKCAVMFELMCNLLRVLEFISAQVPEAFVTGPDKEMNVSRLVETISFVLSHTTNGPDASDFNKVVCLTQDSARSLSNGPGAELEHEEHVKAHAALEKVTRTAVIAPLAGVLFHMVYRGAHSAKEELKEGSRMIVASFCETGELPSQALAFFTSSAGEDCIKACEAPPATAQVEQLREALAMVLKHSEAYKDQQAEEADEAGDIPDDFLDPIQCTLMRDPVTLPDSGVVLDRSTIKRHLLCDPSDPFSRASLTIEQVTPNKELKDRISLWKTDQDRRKTL
jgi:Kip1 ubiquitination-promoting complex protein 1